MNRNIRLTLTAGLLSYATMFILYIPMFMFAGAVWNLWVALLAATSLAAFVVGIRLMRKL